MKRASSSGDAQETPGKYRLPKPETLVVAEATRRSMRANVSRNTKPEMALRKALWKAGVCGYRVHVRKLPGTPDLAFVGRKVCVFVQGCFWHGCPTCTRNRTPRQNAAYWAAKIGSNRERDQRNRTDLEAMGFTVVEVWECRLKGAGIAEVVSELKVLLG